MIVVGVDYSMTCPAMCFMNPEWDTTFANAGFQYMSEKKNEQKEWDVGASMLVGKPTPAYANDQERFTNIATNLIMPFIVHSEKEPVKFYIEGYSYGSRAGMMYNIAEHAGMLKYVLWLNKVEFEVVAPSAIKKFATGKGNADKTKMHTQFACETGVDLMAVMFPDRKGVSSPVSDIVDSYYIARYGVEQERARAK